jgi:DNA polymerase-3 subunit epsilon
LRRVVLPVNNDGVVASQKKGVVVALSVRTTTTMIAPSLIPATFRFGRRLRAITPPYSDCCNRRPIRAFTAAASSPPVLALIFDTETTDKVDFKKPATDPCQPELVQLGMILVDTASWTRKMQISMLIQDVSTSIQPGAQKVHGISVEDCKQFGMPRSLATQAFLHACSQADILVAHNLEFDKKVMEAAIFHRKGSLFVSGNGNNDNIIDDSTLQQICTMQASTEILELPGKFGFKWPSLEEAHDYFTNGENIEGSHDALVDAEACLAVFRGLVEGGFVDLVPRKDKEKCKIFATPQISAPPLPTSVVEDDGDFDNMYLSHQIHTTVPPVPLPTPAAVLPNIVAKMGELCLEYHGSGFAVGGNTFPYRQQLKLIGGRWDATGMAWRFADMSMLEPVKRLAGLANGEAKVQRNPLPPKPPFC